MAERLWPYLITRAWHAPPQGATGVGGGPVRALVEGDLAIWVSPVPHQAGRDLDSIQRHNDVIVSATTPALTPVPLRFGQAADELELRASLAARAPHWHHCLEDFAGASEFGLQVLGPAAQAQIMHAGPGRSGRHYLEALAARQRRAGELTAAIHGEVHGLVRRERVDPVTGDGVLARVAHLVGGPETDAYRAAIGRIARAHPDCQFQSSGPWPPYSFAA